MFNEFLLSLINENGITQKELAKLTQIPYTTLNGWITKKQSPKIEQLITLANYFNVTIDYLVGRENDFGNVEIKQDISNEDANLLIGYHKLDNVQKGKVEGYIYAMNEENKDKTKYGG